MGASCTIQGPGFKRLALIKTLLQWEAFESNVNISRCLMTLNQTSHKARSDVFRDQALNNHNVSTCILNFHYLGHRYTFLSWLEESAVAKADHFTQSSPCLRWLIKTLTWKVHQERDQYITEFKVCTHLFLFAFGDRTGTVTEALKTLRLKSVWDRGPIRMNLSLPFHWTIPFG